MSSLAARSPLAGLPAFGGQGGGPAADAVEAALRQAGYSAERQDKTAGLAEVFEGMGDGLAEWIITTPDGAQLMLQMAYFDRGRLPVLMEFGPVLDLDDAIGGKVAALATRAAERDYLDVAAALARGYSVAQLTALALAAEDFADAGAAARPPPRRQVRPLRASRSLQRKTND